METALTMLSAKYNAAWRIRHLSFRDVPLPIRVEAPERVGIDRLLAALTANHLRQQDRPAVVIDLGTAITVDLVSAQGEFCGGAILPGFALSARALAEQTDALPLVSFVAEDQEPAPVGKSTVGAIESGLYWGAVGAIRELICQYTAAAVPPPDVFLTGGAAERVAARLSTDEKTSSPGFERPINARHVDSLVLSGIALAHEAAEQP
jgi:type III pantothenate kinase